MKNHEIANANNKALEQRFLSKIKELPNHKVSPTTTNDIAFFEPIVELNEKQNANFKKLLQ